MVTALPPAERVAGTVQMQDTLRRAARDVADVALWTVAQAVAAGHDDGVPPGTTRVPGRDMILTAKHLLREATRTGLKDLLALGEAEDWPIAGAVAKKQPQPGPLIAHLRTRELPAGAGGVARASQRLIRLLDDPGSDPRQGMALLRELADTTTGGRGTCDDES